MSLDRPSERISVGLILCDHLDPVPASVAGDYPVLYPAAFAPHGLDIRIYEATDGQLPQDLDECDVWMVSGSRHSAYDDDRWILDVADLISRIVQADRPLAGICFGHQLAARALGGEVQRSETGWGVGGRTFDVVAAPEWMTGPDGSPAEHFTLLMSHRDQVTELPEGAELVATSDYCPVGAYRIGHRLFCVQGHPEFVPGLSETLMEQRRDAIGSDVVDAGLASLHPPAPPLDQDVVSGWIAEFYRQALSR